MTKSRWEITKVISLKTREDHRSRKNYRHSSTRLNLNISISLSTATGGPCAYVIARALLLTCRYAYLEPLNFIIVLTPPTQLRNDRPFSTSEDSRPHREIWSSNFIVAESWQLLAEKRDVAYAARGITSKFYSTYHWKMWRERRGARNASYFYSCGRMRVIAVQTPLTVSFARTVWHVRRHLLYSESTCDLMLRSVVNAGAHWTCSDLLATGHVVGAATVVDLRCSEPRFIGYNATTLVQVALTGGKGPVHGTGNGDTRKKSILV